MSQTAVWNASEAEWFVNHALQEAGSSVRVSAQIVDDQLILSPLDTGSEPTDELVIPRNGFGHWFAETIVPQAMERFDVKPPRP